jgi:S1-C subfamily serine protease
MEPDVNSASKKPSKQNSVSSKNTSRFSGLQNGVGRFRRRARLRYIYAAAVVVIAAAFGFLGGQMANGGDSFVSGSLKDQKKIVTNEGELISQISKSVGPSVVSITTDQQATGSDFFGFNQTQSQQAAGTGMVISKNGVIMTNRHVVPDSSTNITVTLSDGTVFDNVSVLGRTDSNDSLDVAFLKINNLKDKTLTPVVIGNSGQSSVGDSVVAIGNALGEFQNTVTSGIVSGFGRSVEASSGSGASSSDSEDLDNLIQTDAAINEGNSGGPLVNLNGQVIGMNTALASDAQNIGFAIPIDDLKGLISQVLKTGNFSRPYLGVRYVQLTPQVAKQYGVNETSGAYVVPDAVSGEEGVVSGSPADKAGLKAGDVIKKVDGTGMTDNRGLTSLLNRHQPGDTVTLSVNRDGKTISVKVTLGTAPSDS